MFKVLKSKYFWLYSIAVFLIIAFFSFVQIESKNSLEMKEVPVALVDSSKGQQSKNITNKLNDQFSGSDSKIKLIKVNKESELNQGFTDKKYYGALIIDKDFDTNLASQQNYVKGLVMNSMVEANSSNPQMKAQEKMAKESIAQAPNSGNVKVVINQGMNPQISQALNTALPNLVNGLNQGMTQGIQKTLNENKVSLNSNEWSVVNNPIQLQTETKNKIPDKSVNGTAPTILVVLAWLSSLIGSLLLWREHKKHSENSKFSLSLINSQMVTGIIMTVVASLSIYLFASVAFGVPIPDLTSFIGLLMFNIFVFYLIQTCILNWAGFAGWPLIILVWMLSVGTISSAPEMLSPLFKYGIYSWTPMRFSMDMFTNNLYIHGSSITTQTDFIVLSAIGIVALILIYLSSILKRTEK